MCNTDNFSLPSYLPTERHSTLSVLNTIFSVHSLQCVIFHAHIHHPIVVTLTAHIEGTTGCITQKFKKSQLPAQQQEGAPQGVHWLWKVPPPTQRMAWGSAGLRRTREAWREHMWGRTCPSGRTRSHLSSTLWRREKREKVSVSGYFQMWNGHSHTSSSFFSC